MPISAKELNRLSATELVGVRSLSVFERQRDAIDEILLDRNGLPPRDFRSLHSQPDCQVTREYLKSTRSGFYDTIYFVELPIHHFRLECDTHGVVSQEFADLSF